MCAGGNLSRRYEPGWGTRLARSGYRAGSSLIRLLMNCDLAIVNLPLQDDENGRTTGVLPYKKNRHCEVRQNPARLD